MEPKQRGKDNEFPTSDPTDARQHVTVPRSGVPLPSQVRTPAMREVVKGWWTSTERLVPAAEFERVDRERGSREHR